MLLQQWYGYKFRRSSLENYTDNGAAVNKDIIPNDQSLAG